MILFRAESTVKPEKGVDCKAEFGFPVCDCRAGDSAGDRSLASFLLGIPEKREALFSKKIKIYTAFIIIKKCPPC